MTRILLLSPWPPPPDGVGFHSVALVNSWCAEGHETLVVTSRLKRHTGTDPSDSHPDQVSVARVLGLTPRRTTYQLIRDFRPDVVVVQFTIASQNTSLVSTLSLMSRLRRSGLPLVVAFHESAREISHLGPLSKLIYRLAARETTYPIAYSRAASLALKNSGLFKDVSEVPHGCRKVTQVSPEVIARVRNRYDITAPLVLSLGFAHPDKGTELLANSVAAISQRVHGDVQFLFAGSPRKRRGIFRLMGRTDQKYHDRTMNGLASLPGASVEICGFVPEEDLMALLTLSAAVVLPYRRATQSGIANLALSARAVIVASDIPELREDLGAAAHYFRAGSSTDLTDTVISVLTTDQEPFRREAATRASERSYDATAAALLNIGLRGLDPQG